jgi:hypothetical protein
LLVIAGIVDMVANILETLSNLIDKIHDHEWLKKTLREVKEYYEKDG